VANVAPLFLMSLPRSGSTLLQRVLGAHPGISTSSETWLLLPLIYALREQGIYTEYGHRTARSAITSFCDHLPDGRKEYLDAVAALATSLYGRVSGSGSAYFLDKTPRYNLIVDELLEMFPATRPIVLWRNPLAVVASIEETWSRGQWRPYLHKVDLFEGLGRLIAAVAAQPSRFQVVRYEDFVADPVVETDRLLEGLGLPSEPACVDQFSSVKLPGPVGDKVGITRYDRVSQQSLDRWKQTVTSPVRKQWCRRYLSWLGKERLELMGYDIEALTAELDAVPTSLERVPSDLAWAARGVAWSVVEPEINRAKVARLPRWRRVVSHS